MALLGFTLAGYLGTFHRLFELTSHFRLQYLWCAILGGLVLLMVRDWRGVLMALVPLAINAWEVVPWYFGKPAGSAGVASNAPALKVLLSNVYTDNRNSAAILELIVRENPDVIALQEIDDRWVAELAVLAQTHPHHLTVPRPDNFGIGLWSRHPAQISETEPGHTEVPSLLAEFLWHGKAVTLLATHPVPPSGAQGFAQRNTQLEAIAQWARTIAGPCIVIGDLNMSLWSPYHGRFVRDSGLRNARQGFGVLPSWPTFMPFFKIPIDHCLVSPAVEVRAIRTGPNVGSDHLPLMVELGL
jgi:endonuclease/exonuclease/phosphatase (EEP) superfamily protein YafD